MKIIIRILGLFVAALALFNTGIFATQILEGGGSLSHGLAVVTGVSLAFVSLRYLVFSPRD